MKQPILFSSNIIGKTKRLGCCLIIPILAIFSFTLSSQTHEYIFNNNFNEFGSGPALTELLACGATTGSYSTQTSGTTSGACLTSNSYCFNDGGGLQYPNPGLITTSYTINVFFRFSSLGGFARIIDFSNGTADAGIYFSGNCLNLYPNGNVGTCPYFNTNIYYLITFVRDGGTGIISVYVDGTLFGTYNDTGNLYCPSTSATPINFFRDDNVVQCETQPGCVKYISVSPNVSTASDVSLLWNNITTVTHATAAPPPTVTIAPTDSFTCVNSTVALSATSSGTMVWNGGSLFNASNPATINTTGTYTVTATDANGCVNSDSVTVVSNTTPPTVTAGSSGNLTCSVTSVTLTGSSTGNTMVWNGGALINSPNPSTVTATGTYTVTATDAANGCTNTDTITVITDTTQSLLISVNSPTICSGQTVTLTASGGTTYSWSTSETTDSIVVSPSSNTSYTVTATSGSCSDSAIAIVTVSTALTITVNSPTICTGEIALLTATGGATYSWSAGATPTGTNTASASPLTSTSYTVTGVSGTCNGTAIAQVTVNPKPVALFGGESGCQGSAIVFSDSSSTSSGTISTYSWNFGDGSPIDTNPNPSHLFTNVGVYTVTFQVNNSLGCSDTATKTVSLYYNPVTGFTFNNICLGDTMYFTNTSSVNGSTSIANYLWSFGDASPTSSLVNPSHYYTTTGNYTVTLVATTIDGCSGAAIVPVNAFDAPTSAFTSSSNCLSTPAQFTNNSTPPSDGTIANWSWDFGDGTPVNTTAWSPSHQYTASGDYIVTLITYSSNLSCADTLKDTITMLPSAIPNFGYTEVCVNQVMNFTDSSILSGNGLTSWSWNYEDGSPIDMGQNPNHQFIVSGSFPVMLIVTTNNNCFDTIIKNVIVHPKPTAQFSTTNVCLGSLTPFSDLSSIPSNPPNDVIQSRTWNFGDGSPVYNNQNTAHQYSDTGTYSINFIVVSNFGCADSTTKTATVSPNPAADFTSSSTLGCGPLCINFQDSSYISAGAVNSFQWDWGDGSPTDSTQNSAHCYNNPGSSIAYHNVTLTVTSDSGCVNSLSKNSYVTVYPSPVANFTLQPETTTIVNPVISITDASSGAVVWNWDFGDGSTSSDTSFVSDSLEHTYADTGSYTITLIATSLYGCSDTTYKNPVVEQDFLFYIPNGFSPNNDGNNDIFSPIGIFVGKFEMRIYDRWGNLIFYSNDFNKGWDGKVNNRTAISQQETYVYVIKATDIKKRKHYYRGTITVVR